MKKTILFFLMIFSFSTTMLVGQENYWLPVTNEMKPWGHYWWLGSSVDKENLAWNMKQYADGGMGGFLVWSAYGVEGQETIPFMSPKWLEMIKFTVEEAGRLGLGVDMTLNTGWNFGGPMIPVEKGSIVARFEKKDGQYVLIPQYNIHPVKRATAGSDGPMVNPFSVESINLYTIWFDEQFEKANFTGPFPRAFQHDSFEYQNNWSNDFLEQFEKRHGYKLQDEYAALNDEGDVDRIRRVKADYRKTGADLYLEFTNAWVDWARSKGRLTEIQGHGAPANLLDIYGAVDIPEMEFFGPDNDPIFGKFSSSAAHVLGRKWVSSEAGTWLKEHFHSTLGDIKVLIDGMFISGVNNIIYHSTVYSPKDAAWPGWLYYASIQMNPNNSIWYDAKYLNEYIARCQSILQSGSPNNDFLIYWPADDLWSEPTGLQLFCSVHVDWCDWLRPHSIGILAKQLFEQGYQFDYISDLQLEQLVVKDGVIVAPGASYKAIVVPQCRYLPPKTMRRFLELAALGANILFDEDVPTDVPGWSNLEARRKTLREMVSNARIKNFDPQSTTNEKMVANISKNRDEALRSRGIVPESIVEKNNVRLIRREIDSNIYYFITNITDKMRIEPDAAPDFLDQWVSLAGVSPTDDLLLMNPMDGTVGKAKRNEQGDVRLQLAPYQSLLLRAGSSIEAPPWNYHSAISTDTIEISEPWQIEFIQGGPELPATRTIEKLRSWTEFNDEQTESFAGTAKYSTTFSIPPLQQGETYQLDLGKVCDSARVRLNGTDLGCYFVYPYLVVLPPQLLRKSDNLLEIEVTNLSANRIRDLDRRQVPWKIFTNINMVDINYVPMDASKWSLLPSGLIGPVRLVPVVIP